MNKPAVHVRAGAFLCVSRGCRVLGHSVLSRVCGVCMLGCHRSTAFSCFWVWLFSRGGAPSEEGSAIPGFSALSSPFIHPGGTWQAAETQGPAELRLSLVA